MRRFVFLTQYYPPEVGAPQVRLRSVARELVRSGHRVEVVTAMPNHPTGRVHEGYRRKVLAREVVDGVVIHRTWIYAATGAGLKRMLNYGSFTLTCLAGLARCGRPDVVFVESPPLFLSFPAWLAGLVWRRPYIFNVADLWPDSAVEMGVLSEGRLARLMRGFERWSYRRAWKVNAVTEGIRDVLVDGKGVPPSDVTFLPNGCDTELFRPGAPDADLVDRFGSGPLLVYAGTLGLAQGLDVALDAMRIVADRHPEARLLLVGSGSDRDRLAARVRDERLDNVTVVDPVPVEEVARLYRLAFAGLATLKDLPLFEGARPSKVFPVMSSGLPVVYSGRGEGARLIGDAGAGVVVPPEDATALAAAIDGLLDDPEGAATMGANGRALVEREFSWPALVQAWLDQLELSPRGR